MVRKRPNWWIGALVAVLLSLAPAAIAAAAPISTDTLGVNSYQLASNYALASAAGVGQVRDQIPEGADTDAIVWTIAAAHLRLYPALGLPRSNGALLDAVQMVSYATGFASRYGPNGSFWAQHPEVPYLPVTTIEIGNEPDINPSAPLDPLSLHYANPSEFALVYTLARNALHALAPGIKVVVGGVLDSGGTPLSEAERYLAAIGPADAIGYHPYLYDLGTMEADTLALRQWLNANGKASVPIDVNEFGSGEAYSSDIGAWGGTVSAYTRWALCTPGLGIEHVSPFWWGAIPTAGTDWGLWYSLTDQNGQPTRLGASYLQTASALTTQGCTTAASARSAKKATSKKKPKKKKSKKRKKSKKAAQKKKASAKKKAPASRARS